MDHRVNDEFLEYCNAIEGNRPDIYSVELSADNIPRGCLRRICDAILRNTHITELLFNVLLILDETIESASSLIQFVRTSTTLRKVGVFHHYTVISHAQLVQRMDQFARLMFEAVAINTSIQELDIAGSFHIDALHVTLSTSTSLKTLHVDCDCLNQSHNDRFLRALTSNRSIDNLSLTIKDNGWMWLEEIPSRMGNGPTTLQGLTLVQCETFPPQFYNLLSTTTSLQTLTMYCTNWNELPEAHQTRLLRAFADNTSIVHLKLDAINVDGIMIDKILQHLPNGPSTLRKLSLMAYSNNFSALKQYLCTSSSTASMLQHLELEDCDLELNGVVRLVKGFRVLDSSPSATTRTQLALNSCRLTEAAAYRLIKLIAARNTCQQEVNTLVLMSLPEPDCVDMAYPAPKLRGTQYIPGNFMEVSVTSTGSMIPPSEDAAWCVSSLSMRSNGNVPAFSDEMVASAGMSSLVCLKLWNVRPRDSTKLALWLSRTVSLRALHLVDIQNNVVPEVILNGLARNGSVLTSTFMKGGNRPFFQRARDRTLVQSYSQRNRFLLEIILKKRVFWNVPIDATDIMPDDDTNGSDVDDDTSNINNDRLVLLPKLLYATNAIPLSRSWFNLAALLTLGSSLGPQG